MDENKGNFSPIETYLRLNPSTIPTAPPPAKQTLYQKYVGISSYYQEQMREGRRRRIDTFSAIVGQQCEHLARSYYADLQLFPPNDSLARLLRTCRLRNKDAAITVSVYSDNGKRSERIFNENSIADLFHRHGIIYDEYAARRLLYALALIRRESAATQWNDALNELAVENRFAAIHLQNVYTCFDVYDGHLVYINPALPKGMAARTAASFATTLGISPSAGKKIFTALRLRLIGEHSLVSSDHAHILDHISHNCVAVYKANGSLFGGYLNGCELELRKIEASIPSHSLGAIDISTHLHNPGKNDIPSKLISDLTGSNSETIDRLAKLFADIADPRCNQRRLTVVFTKQNTAAVQSLLSEAFECSNEPVTINSLLTQKGRLELVNRHIQGNRLIFIKDTPPSDRNVSDFLTLAKGGQLTFNEEFIGKQSFENNLQLVCITDKPSVAKVMSERYGADVINLSRNELVCEHSRLTAAQKFWLRTAFVLHGCKVKHTEKHGNRKRSASSIATSEISAFIKNRCIVSKKAVCERNELFNAYRAYYEENHGCMPPESSAVFTKYAKAVIPNSVCYKVKRYGEGRATHMCYVGLGIRKTAVDTPKNPTELHGSLDGMSRERDRLFSEKIDAPWLIVSIN